MRRLALVFMFVFVTFAYSANMTNELKIEKNSNLKYYIVNDSKHLLQTSNGKMDKFDTIASSESFYADMLFYKTEGARVSALVSLSNVTTYEKDPAKGMEIKSKNDLTDLDETGGEVSFSKNGLDAQIENIDNVNSLSYLILPDILAYLENLAVPLPVGKINQGTQWEAEKDYTQKYEFATLVSKHKIRYTLKDIKEYQNRTCAEVDFETVSNTYESQSSINAFKSNISGKAMLDIETGIVVNLQFSNNYTLVSTDKGLSYHTETSSYTEYMLREK